MGYGNSLFDGDEPLPSVNPKQRILSMRLWLGAALAGAASSATPAGEASGLPDRRHEQQGGERGAANEWRPGRGERNPQG